MIHFLVYRKRIIIFASKTLIMKNKKVRERVDYDAMFGEEMIKRIAKMGFKLKSYCDVGNGRVRLNFTKE